MDLTLLVLNLPRHSQDITGVVSDPSKKGSVRVLSGSSKSDGVQSEGSSTSGQGEAEEGDLSRKDKVSLAFECESSELSI